MNRRSISGNNTEQVLQSQITDLQSNIVVSGTNVVVGPNALNIVTTGTGNTAIGSDAGGSPYGVAEGSGNVMVGASAGSICSGGSNNTFLGSNTDFTPRVGYYNGSIALGSGAIITGYNQLMVAPNFTAFNMAGLAASTGTCAGTILEFDSAGNVLPTAGTYKTVAAIGTAIAAINAPYAMSWNLGTATTFDSSSSPQPLALWNVLVFGSSANMASASTWTCPAAGLWNISASYGISLSVTNGYVQAQLYHNGSSTFLTTLWVNVYTAGDGIVKNIESILLNLAAGDTLEWYVTVDGYTAKIGGVTTNGGTTTFNAVRIAPGFMAA